MTRDSDLAPAVARLDVGPADFPRTPTIRIPPGEDMWVFGYGSLMWSPGFPYVERETALLRGFHRRFCVYSTRYRGTPERQGLVLDMHPSGPTSGIAARLYET